MAAKQCSVSEVFTLFLHQEAADNERIHS
jgi:hypothetical protein